MMTARNILYPTDFSELSRCALEVAAALAKQFGSRLAVLHVKEPPGIVYGEFAAVPAPEEDQEIVLERLTSHRPDDPDIPVAHHLVQGDPADEIIRMARKLNADWIVMSSHGRSGLQRLLMGSVAEEVARNAHCPVLIVRNGTEAFADEHMEAEPLQNSGAVR